MSDISCLASSLPVYFAFIGHTDVLIKQTLSDFRKEPVTSIAIKGKECPSLDRLNTTIFCAKIFFCFWRVSVELRKHFAEFLGVPMLAFNLLGVRNYVSSAHQRFSRR